MVMIDMRELCYGNGDDANKLLRHTTSSFSRLFDMSLKSLMDKAYKFSAQSGRSGCGKAAYSSLEVP